MFSEPASVLGMWSALERGWQAWRYLSLLFRSSLVSRPCVWWSWELGNKGTRGKSKVSVMPYGHVTSHREASRDTVRTVLSDVREEARRMPISDEDQEKRTVDGPIFQGQGGASFQSDFQPLHRVFLR